MLGIVESPRAQAVKRLLPAIDQMVIVGALPWSLEQRNVLGLAINHSVRRQREALGSAVALTESGTGHLSVGFVRPALDEWLWLAFLCELEEAQATELLLALGRYDAVRSLMAQRDYLGEQAMADLWYPEGFVDRQAAQLAPVREKLKDLGRRFGWGNAALPTSEWIATQVGMEAEYRYLHSATSRALHFSAGEIMRRGWGTPGGVLVTDKAEFREHLAEFALDSLWHIWFSTLAAVLPRLDGAGITSDPLFNMKPQDLVGELLSLGRVPLVHAQEWNLTPEGPLPPPSTPGSKGPVHGS